MQTTLGFAETTSRRLERALATLETTFGRAERPHELGETTRERAQTALSAARRLSAPTRQRFHGAIEAVRLPGEHAMAASDRVLLSGEHVTMASEHVRAAERPVEAASEHVCPPGEHVKVASKLCVWPARTRRWRASPGPYGPEPVRVPAARLSKARHALPIRIVLFANEEPPYSQTDAMGSLQHAEGCKARGESVRAMLSLETMRHFSDAVPSSTSQKKEKVLDGISCESRAARLPARRTGIAPAVRSLKAIEQVSTSREVSVDGFVPCSGACERGQGGCYMQSSNTRRRGAWRRGSASSTVTTWQHSATRRCW